MANVNQNVNVNVNERNIAKNELNIAKNELNIKLLLQTLNKPNNHSNYTQKQYIKIIKDISKEVEKCK